MVRKVGWVGSCYGLVWFIRNSEAEFKTINESMNDKGGHRAARAAKKEVFSLTVLIPPYVLTQFH